MDEIQTHSKPVIEHCYREFLIENHDPDERAYPDPADQICEVLIHENYLSQRDIDICLRFDVECLKKHDGFEGFKALHDALRKGYKADAPNGVTS